MLWDWLMTDADAPLGAVVATLLAVGLALMVAQERMRAWEAAEERKAHDALLRLR